MKPSAVGISGFALYVPPYRVDLEEWCDWTGNPWNKISRVIGHSFRMPGPVHNVYTMAATAAIRLIDSYDIDPETVGFLGLGTESSSDNSAGAIIVKGMLDETLQSVGKPGLSRHCQVPEYKHACLGGVYAMKDALRWLALNEDAQSAIVVAADIANYHLGSSGEPTQGAGAVAMLLERNPQLLEVDVVRAGSASAYRGVDFRKPRHRCRSNGNGLFALPDTPVFNGKYSVSCYLDQTQCALDDMLRRLGTSGVDYFQDLQAVFMHRPYERMPINSWALNYLSGLASNGAAGRAELSAYCDSATLDTDAVVNEMRGYHELLAETNMEVLDREAFPLSMQLLRAFRSHPSFKPQVEDKLQLGLEVMRDIGNIYAAALPAWMAAGMEDAWRNNVTMSDKPVLALGYGSGDAAEALPMSVSPEWADAASRINFAAALRPYQRINRDQYYSLHETGSATGLDWFDDNAFLIDSVGCLTLAPVTNDGIETYRFNHPAY